MIRKPDTDEEDQEPGDNAKLKSDETWLHDRDPRDPETQRMLARYQEAPMPLDQDYVRAAREKRFAKA